MQLVTRKDPRVQTFIENVRRLDQDLVEIVLQRDLLCVLLSEPNAGENQIFGLRPVKPAEIRASDKTLFTDPIERAAFASLVELSKDSFPTLVADFRICLEMGDRNMAFLADYYGDRTEARPVDYFRVSSPAALRLRRQKLGCIGNFWARSGSVLTEFYDYCLGPNQQLLV